MNLSIVTTLFQSEPYLTEFHHRASAAARQLVGNDYQIVLVNDGSPDNSLNLAIQLSEADSHVIVVDLSRNFGHHAAIIAGLEQAIGEYIFLIDCDLEEQPEWLSLFKEQMELSNADVVFGVQQERVASKISNIFGSLFWKTLNFMSNVRIPNNPMTCRLMNRNYVNSLLSVGDRVLYLAGVFAWTGYRQLSLPLVKTPRPSNHKSSYALSRKLLQAADSFSSFSAAPLTIIFATGLLIWITSIIYGIYLISIKILNPEIILSGFSSLMLSIWFLSGFIIFSLGTIGLYIGKIFQEVKRRPLYITKKIHKSNTHE